MLRENQRSVIAREVDKATTTGRSRTQKVLCLSRNLNPRARGPLGIVFAYGRLRGRTHNNARRRLFSRMASVRDMRGVRSCRHAYLHDCN